MGQNLPGLENGDASYGVLVEVMVVPCLLLMVVGMEIHPLRGCRLHLLLLLAGVQHSVALVPVVLLLVGLQH